MKKIVLLSHCVLNSFCEEPPAADTFRADILNCFLEKGISMIQLPCPELCYQGINRKSIYPGTEEAADYEKYCKDLIKPAVSNIKQYKEHDIEISAIIGIDTSPSCSVIDKEAIMMKALCAELDNIGISNLKLIDMPVGDYEKSFIDEIKKL